MCFEHYTYVYVYTGQNCSDLFCGRLIMGTFQNTD